MDEWQVVEENKFWQKVYIACVRAGCGSATSKARADQAVKDLRAFLAEVA